MKLSWNCIILPHKLYQNPISIGYGQQNKHTDEQTHTDPYPCLPTLNFTVSSHKCQQGWLISLTFSAHQFISCKFLRLICHFLGNGGHFFKNLSFRVHLHWQEMKLLLAYCLWYYWSTTLHGKTWGGYCVWHLVIHRLFQRNKGRFNEGYFCHVSSVCVRSESRDSWCEASWHTSFFFSIECGNFLITLWLFPFCLPHVVWMSGHTLYIEYACTWALCVRVDDVCVWPWLGLGKINPRVKTVKKISIIASHVGPNS